MTTARALLLLLPLTVVVHLPFLGGGWTTDDFAHIDILQRQRLSRVFATPDIVGYYRPVTQASLLANLRVNGENPFAFRLTNLVLHGAVVCAAFLLASMLAGDRRAALLATLAFVLAPKAPSIAVQWISARPELLMSLFALTAVICWLRWQRGAGAGWFAAAWACYVLAFLSKESAALLPILLLVTPPGKIRARRVAAAAALVLSAAALVLLRSRVGARMPFSDAQYEVTMPLARYAANGWNYFTRAIPAPAALVVLAAIATRGGRLRPGRSGMANGALAILAFAWFFVFMAPVFPLAGRSELYLYLAGYGFCVAAGIVAGSLVTGRPSRAVIVALAVFVAGLAGYQVTRADASSEVQTFSARLEAALRADPRVRSHTGHVTLVPGDAETERLLRDAIGGYFEVAIKVMLGRQDIGGHVAYGGEHGEHSSDLTLGCRYSGGDLLLQ